MYLKHDSLERSAYFTRALLEASLSLSLSLPPLERSLNLAHIYYTRALFTFVMAIHPSDTAIREVGSGTTEDPKVRNNL